jgi:hypothetical protein
MTRFTRGCSTLTSISADPGPAQEPRPVDGLVRRGYSDAEIAKIVGGNWIRVFGEVWEDHIAAGCRLAPVRGRPRW